MKQILAVVLVSLGLIFIGISEPAVAENVANSPPSAQLPSPKTEVQGTLDQIVKAVASNPGDELATQRRAKLREIISPNFDFAEMAKRALGTHWNDCTESERAEYVRIFSDVLAKTYLSRIDTVTEDMVKVTSDRIVFPKALVKTTVTSKGDAFPIDYKLLFSEGRWKVYDVIIENIGLVANYRNEFSGIIRREKFAGLMERLRAKIGDSAT